MKISWLFVHVLYTWKNTFYLASRFNYFILCRLHRIYHNYHHHTNGFSFHSSVVYVAIEADLIDILKVPSSELRITGVIGGRLKLFVIGVLERRSLHKRSL